MTTAAPDPDVADAAGSPDVTFEPRLAGVVAEFREPEALMHAAAAVRDAGFTRWDTHTPYPLHGIDQAMGLRPTVLPWIVLLCGITGATIALSMQFYMNGWAGSEKLVGWPWTGYPYPISGKPLFSLPANIPITFELTVLLSAFGAFFGQIALNRLLKFYDPKFKLERFRAVTDDRFFLSVDAADPKFDSARVGSMLSGLGAQAVDECWDDEPRKIPSGLATAGLILFALALVPPVLILRHRAVAWETPEYHLVQDMDFQAKYKAQQRNTFFADNRANRPNPAGTVARGQFDRDEAFYTGVRPGQPMASLQDPGGPNAGGPAGGAVQGGPGGGDAAPSDDAGNRDDPGGEGKDAGVASGPMNEKQDWVETIPVQVSEKMMERGREQFGIYCAPCHGVAGYGDGIVNQRAVALQQPTWLPVPSLHTPATRGRADGYIFRAISDGVRKMPAYGSQVQPEDRWAIVLYVRALQRSQNAAAGDAE